MFIENLVWSGAHLLSGRTVTDFRVSPSHDQLSMILNPGREHDEASAGSAIIINSSLGVSRRYDESVLLQGEGERTMNMHEFKIMSDGKSALRTMGRLSGVRGSRNGVEALVMDQGFQRFDLETGEPLFHWWAHTHIDLAESVVDPVNHSYWDYLCVPSIRVTALHSSDCMHRHVNSIDEDIYGNYLLSARHTNTVYNISRAKGAVNWRLGGRNSSFQLLHGLSWYGQHDAKIISHNTTAATLSLLDNGSNEIHTESLSSSALLIELDLTAMTARQLQRWPRPDGGLTQLRGNVQLLENGVFICWSDNSYISEHSLDGRLLFEARFRSNRFVTYRAYKANFSMTPSEPPRLKSWEYGASPERAITLSFVSWNGATKVSTWNFFGRTSDGPSRSIGVSKERGFETSLKAEGYFVEVYAVAHDAGGMILGQTDSELTVIPEDWLDEDMASEGMRSLSGSRLSAGLYTAVGVVLALLTITIAAVLYSGSSRTSGYRRVTMLS